VHTWPARRLTVPHRPSRDDPFLAAASTAIGGPAGGHARPHPRLTPLVVALGLIAATFALGVAAKTACAEGAWWNPPRQFANLCYSDLPYQYVNGGRAERVAPLTESDGRYPPPTDSPPVAVLSWVAALATHALVGWPDVVERDDRPVAEVAADPQVRHEAVVYVGVVAVMLLGAAWLAVTALVRAHGSRPWDAAGFAAAPVLAASALISWDLVGVACVCTALWAWARRRSAVAGLLVGLGTAVTVYPALVLLAFGVVAVRAGRLDAAGRAAGAAVVAFVTVLLPTYLLAPQHAWGFVDAYVASGPGNGSVWQVFGAFGWRPDATLTNQLSLVVGAALVAALVWLGLTTGRSPRVPQLALLVLLAVLLVSKEYAPQQALWLLPLAVLARPYWRDLLIWQAGEVFYVLAIWWHLGGFTHAGGNSVDEVYVWAICVRLAAQLWLGGVVLRDIMQPWFDPVRADGTVDDPAGGVADTVAEAERHPVPVGQAMSTASNVVVV